MVRGNAAFDERPAEISGRPIKYCSVPLSEAIEKGCRLDANVFDVEAKQARNLVANGRYPVRMVAGEDGLASAATFARFRRIWVKKSEYPIFQPSAITEINPAPDGFLSPNTQTDIDALRVHSGQVLMTCSGTIGKLGYVSKTLNNKIFSHDLLRLTCRNPQDGGFLYAYLKSAAGNKILLTNEYGAVISHIEPEHLAAMPIPDPPALLKKRISDLIVESYESRDESNSLLDQATALLIENLQFPRMDDFNSPAHDENSGLNSFNVKLSEMAGRADASYHLPIAAAIVAHMKKHAEEVAYIEDARISRDVVLPPRFSRVYVNEGYGRVLIGGKQLYELNPSGKKYISISRHKDILEKLEIQQNTILITRSGTIGKVALAPEHWTQWVPSEHIIRVVPANSEIAGYLSIFLASEYARPLITRNVYGSVIDEIDDAHVRKIPVPLLKNHDLQKKINDLALEANEKRYEAYRLEEKALKMMDEEVIWA